MLAVMLSRIGRLSGFDRCEDREERQRKEKDEVFCCSFGPVADGGAEGVESGEYKRLSVRKGILVKVDGTVHGTGSLLKIPSGLSMKPLP